MDPDSLVGRTLGGRFRVDRILGRGGMATVFAARDERDNRDVALKVLKRELTRDPMVLRRFEREAKAASHLSHPNIIEVYDFGVEDNDAFISMELANGVDLLKALSRERPMRQSRSVLLVSQVCAALTVAHGKGIVHRDLKPENVVLVPEPREPGGERAKVLDFGIAKILDVAPKGGADASDPPSYVTKTALTRVGTIVGTPAYMSPEQCRGGEVDGRSDVYACGILLYQLVTGELPFTGETPLHTAMRHIHAQPRRPSELREDLHPTLEKIILKALAKWPGERHQSAEALRDDLMAVLAELPDRAADVVLAAPSTGGGPQSPRAPTEPTRHLVGGPLGSTPLRAVRLGGLANAEPEPPITEASTSPTASGDDDDEPRTFQMRAEDAEASALSNGEPLTDPNPANASATSATPTVGAGGVPNFKTDPLGAARAERGATTAPRAPSASVTDLTDTPRAPPPPRGAVDVRTTPLASASPGDFGVAKTALAPEPLSAQRVSRPRTLASAKGVGSTQRGVAASVIPVATAAPSTDPPARVTEDASTATPRSGRLGGAPLGSLALGSHSSTGPDTAHADTPRADSPRAIAPRRLKQTETGLTPTSPKRATPPVPPREAPVAATALSPQRLPQPAVPSAIDDDDDEPSTNIRDVTGVGLNPLMQADGRAAASPNDSRVHKTLVMEETKSRQQAAEILGMPVGPQPGLPQGVQLQLGLSQNQGSPPPAAVAGLAPTQPQLGMGHAQHAPQAQPSPRPVAKSVPPPHDGRLHGTPMRIGEETDAGLGQVKSTVRMGAQEIGAQDPLSPASQRMPESMRMIPSGNWNDPTSLSRREAPRPKRTGFLGFFEELPGTTGLIIGIGLGLGIAGGAIIAFILLK